MSKKTFLVIGIGTFGFNLARELADMGHEVVAVDRDQRGINEIRDLVSEAVVADATDREALDQLGIDHIDAAVVCMGQANIGPSVLVTLHLKDMDADEIVVVATSPEHGRIVEKIGATSVVFPDVEVALRLARSLSTPHMFSQFDLPQGYSLIEIKAPKELQDKTLLDAKIRSNYGITVVLIKRTGENGEEISIIPSPQDSVYENDVLFVIGEEKEVENFKKLDV